MLRERREEALRERVAVERLRIGADAARQAARGGEPDRGQRRGAVDDGEQSPFGDHGAQRRAQPGAGPPAWSILCEGKLLCDDSDREDQREHDQLRAGERREHQTGQRQDVVAQPRDGRRALEGEHRPEEGRVCSDLGQEERRKDDPRDGDADRRNDVRGQPTPRDTASEQEGGYRGRGHHVRVEHMCVVERERDVAVAIDRRDQQRVELADVRDQRSVDTRERGTGARDADRESFVEQFVGHHEPVDDSAGDLRERGAEHQPEHDRRQLEPEDHGDDRASDRARLLGELADCCHDARTPAGLTLATGQDV